MCFCFCFISWLSFYFSFSFCNFCLFVFFLGFLFLFCFYLLVGLVVVFLLGRISGGFFVLFFVVVFEPQLQADLWLLAAWWDIFLHCPESTHKNRIGKTFTHTAIPIQSCTLLKQRAKPSTHQTWRLRLVVLCAAGRRPGSLADAPRGCSTSEAFSPRPRKYSQKTFVHVFNKYSNIVRQQCRF